MARVEHLRLVLPHQLFRQHLDAPAETVFVLVEADLLYRQYAFHQHKLVLHRASMRAFADRLREAGFEVVQIDSEPVQTTREQLAEVVRTRLAKGGRVTAYDVVDDWLGQEISAALEDAGHTLRAEDVEESPNFLTTRAQVRDQLGGRPRMQHFYAWQRRRLEVLVEGDEPVGGQWSFDADNRRKLPKGHPVPTTTAPERSAYVEEAIAWVREHFADNPGDAETFCHPVTHEEAEAGLEEFLTERFAEFGPFEDAISVEHPHLFHAVITPGLNIGLLDPHDVLERALQVGAETDVPLNSLEGFVRQLIGWREYMRGTYLLHGRAMRTSNRLEHGRTLSPGWWTAETGLDPVDHVVRGVLERAYAHHIERLMVLGNAMCLLRIDPDEVYRWFMELFIDAYDWVMVPNVYAMSQYAAGSAITTKPYVSGSNYLRKMTDLPRGDWEAEWDALYWTFVRDHRDVFEANNRSRMMVAMYDRMEPATKAGHTRRAHAWLE